MFAIAVNPGANESTDTEGGIFVRSSHERLTQEASKRGACFAHAGSGVGRRIAINVSAVRAACGGKRPNLCW